MFSPAPILFLAQMHTRTPFWIRNNLPSFEYRILGIGAPGGNPCTHTHIERTHKHPAGSVI